MYFINCSFMFLNSDQAVYVVYNIIKKKHKTCFNSIIRFFNQGKIETILYYLLLMCSKTNARILL